MQAADSTLNQKSLSQSSLKGDAANADNNAGEDWLPVRHLDAVLELIANAI
jgi:hypothetical protein